MKYPKREDGIAQILIVGLVAVVMVVIGLAVWQAQKAKANLVSSSPTPTVAAKSSSSPTPTAAPTPANEIKVTELGFKMTLPTGLTDLKYVAETGISDPAGNGTLARASFSTTSLEQKDSNSLCQAAKGPIGFISRYEAEPKSLESGPVRESVRKVGNFYLAFGPSQSACSDNNGVPGLQDSQTKLLEQAFDGASAL